MENETLATSETGRPAAPAHIKQRHFVLVLVAIVLLASAAVAFALRLGEHRALAKETEALAVPSVVVVQPKAEPAQQDLTLPSTLQAFTESPIYARTSGYVARWYQDIGSQVKKG